jgi:hypothetical protein
MYTNVSRDPADMQRLYCIDYNTNDNPLSPTYALPAHWLERVTLNDEQQLQMFERRVSITPEMCAYRCPIVSKVRHSAHAANENNVVYVSWLFYLYLQGLLTQGIIPCMLVSLLKTYPTTSIQLEGRQVKRQRLDVMMDFVTAEQLEELQGLLREESVKISPTRLRTHIYVSNAAAIAKLFQEEYTETLHHWTESLFLLPEPYTLSHDGRY